jgi:hypothetical protein
MSDSPETVALGLLQLLLQNDKMAAEFRERAPGAARNWLLNSYAECLRAVQSGRERGMDRPGKPGASGPFGAPMLEEGGDGGSEGAPEGWSVVPDHQK